MKLKSHILLTILVGFAVFALAFTTTAAFAGSGEPPAAPKRVQLAYERFSAWEYTSFREDKDVTLEIRLNDTSVAGLEAFRSANQLMASDLVKQLKMLRVNLILNQPLSVEALTTLVNNYQLQVKSFQIRVIDGHHDRVTLFIQPDGGKLYSDALVQPMLNWVKEQSGEAQFLGVTTIEAELNPSDYDRLNADPSVFLVDVTPSFAEQHLKQNHASLLHADDLFTTAAFPIYWYLEDSRQSNP